MVPCQRCGKGEAEWRCQTCGRVVDTACARPTPDGVFCIDHAPLPGQAAKQEESKESGGSKALKQLFFTLLFLTLGLGMLIFVGDYLITKMFAGLADATGWADMLKTTGWMMVYGMGGLTVLIGAAWVLTLRRRK